MAAVNDFGCVGPPFQIGQKLISIFCVATHRLPFLIIQSAGLPPDSVENFKLSDVVQQRAMFDLHKTWPAHSH
jgi:hypothetical protein